MRIKGNWGSMTLEQWEETPGFPTAGDMRSMVDVLYRTSLSVDEGRYPQILFVFPATQSVDPTFVPLGAGRPVFLPEIISIAPAIAPPPFALVLQDNYQQRCLGIVRLDASRLRPGVYLGVRGPGDLEVTVQKGERSSWIHREGEWREASSLHDSEHLRELCGGDLGFKVLRNVVYSVSRRRHGGLLLFCDGEPSGVTHPLISFEKDPLPLVTKLNVPPRELESVLLHRAEVVACFNQIDGGLLFDRSLRLRGTGVFLEVGHTKVWPTGGRFRGEATDIDDLGLGTRHRAAASFCARNPGALAVVVSQDKVIRVFREKGTRVLLDGPFADLMLFST